MYRVDPNDSKKQIPKALPNDVFDRAIAASASNHSFDVPDQVYVAVSRTNLQFQFGQSGSGFVNFGTVPIGTKLDIKPTAWNNSAAAAGDVIYIYKGRK
tara:strand:- start:1290 stop:1586 length:297 start_codon:yes stop_codon:yes gene_type:complete